MSKDNLNQFEERITFEIKNDKINIKNYGGSWGSTPIFAQYPHNYLVVVDLKDNKYRVTISDIEIDYSATNLGNSDLVDTVTKKRNTQFRTVKQLQ